MNNRIVTDHGIFVRVNGVYEPAAEPAIAHPILLNIALVIIGAWGVVGGIFYGAYLAVFG